MPFWRIPVWSNNCGKRHTFDWMFVTFEFYITCVYHLVIVFFEKEGRKEKSSNMSFGALQSEFVTFSTTPVPLFKEGLGAKWKFMASHWKTCAKLSPTFSQVLLLTCHWVLHLLCYAVKVLTGVLCLSNPWTWHSPPWPFLYPHPPCVSLENFSGASISSSAKWRFKNKNTKPLAFLWSFSEILWVKCLVYYPIPCHKSLHVEYNYSIIGWLV